MLQGAGAHKERQEVGAHRVDHRWGMPRHLPPSCLNFGGNKTAPWNFHAWKLM